MEEHQNDMLPSSPTQIRSDAVIVAGELSKPADMIKCPRTPEPQEFEATAGHFIAAGNFGMEELVDTSAAERRRFYETLADHKPRLARLPRKMLDAKAPPTEAELKKPAPFKEIVIFVTVKANRGLAGIGKISRSRQGSADISCEAWNEGAQLAPLLRLSYRRSSTKPLGIYWIQPAGERPR